MLFRHCVRILRSALALLLLVLLYNILLISVTTSHLRTTNQYQNEEKKTEVAPVLKKKETTIEKHSSIKKKQKKNDLTKNEEMYDAKYWAYQQKMNKFGAAYKGDIIRHIIGGNNRILSDVGSKILEFGCSGGHILASMPGESRYGVEVNPAARAYAKENFPDRIMEIFSRIEEISSLDDDDDDAANLKFDVIFTTSVLEHVDCPLCELRKLKLLLRPNGILIVGLKNDGIDLLQTFDKHKNDQNHHIYTWNDLLLTNLLDAAGYTPCNVIGQHDAWHSPIEVSIYEKDKLAYCRKGLDVGKKQNVYNMWSVSVLPENKESCVIHAPKVKEIEKCRYIEMLS